MLWGVGTPRTAAGAAVIALSGNYGRGGRRVYNSPQGRRRRRSAVREFLTPRSADAGG